jgi:hypothetical protein
MPSKKTLKKRLRKMKHDRNGWRDAIELRDSELDKLRAAATRLVIALDNGHLDGIPVHADEVRLLLGMTKSWTLAQIAEARNAMWETRIIDDPALTIHRGEYLSQEGAA